MSKKPITRNISAINILLLVMPDFSALESNLYRCVGFKPGGQWQFAGSAKPKMAAILERRRLMKHHQRLAIRRKPTAGKGRGKK